MPMKHVMAHVLPQDVARRVAEHAFHSYRERYARYQPTLTWVSDRRADASFNAKGIPLHGTIELLPQASSFNLEVPFVLRIFRSKAMEIMERELAHWIEKAKRGEI